jgi:hypothetical protein
MIRKLIISAAILTALIVSKESHAAGAAGFARDLAVSPALVLSASDWNFSDDEAISSPAPAIDGMVTDHISDGTADKPAANILLPSAISLFHPF